MIWIKFWKGSGLHSSLCYWCCYFSGDFPLQGNLQPCLYFFYLCFSAATGWCFITHWFIERFIKSTDHHYISIAYFCIFRLDMYITWKLDCLSVFCAWVYNTFFPVENLKILVEALFLPVWSKIITLKHAFIISKIKNKFFWVESLS